MNTTTYECPYCGGPMRSYMSRMCKACAATNISAQIKRSENRAGNNRPQPSLPKLKFLEKAEQTE